VNYETTSGWAVAKFEEGSGGFGSSSKGALDRDGHDSSEEDGSVFRCNIGTNHSLRPRKHDQSLQFQKA
jgi:hypothetical protein